MSSAYHCIARSIALFIVLPQTPVFAEESTLPAVTVTASPFGNDDTTQILTPAKVLAGDELRDKLGGSLGETLSQEMGVSASSFGAGASRPVIRGLDGPRIKILQNGMAVSDMSSLSNDHAVGSSAATATQIEILRGPAALAYGSGAIGGLINIVNGRIPEELTPRPSGEFELRHSSVDDGNGGSFNVDGSSGKIGLHADGSMLRAGDYRTPSGILPASFNHEDNSGFGAASIGDWGHAGLSLGMLNKRYGIPTAEQSRIDLSQTRVDFDSLFKTPVPGFDSVRIKLANTDYQHSELSKEGIAQTNFSSASLESRLELAHQAFAGWRGKFGLQSEQNRFAALAADGSAETVPVTHSTSTAGFIVEEKEFGTVRVNTGARYEFVARTPENNLKRSFDLASWSGGALWQFTPGYGLGATYSIAQRAPTTEELYANGPHEATNTFDIGSTVLGKETSHNIELSLQKTKGVLRWKGNLFQNKVQDFIYGLNGDIVSVDGSNFTQRRWSQADATLYGGEAEFTYQLAASGWSVRGFGDISRGRLDGGDNLPLQPAARLGLGSNYQQGAWRGNLSIIRTAAHERVAITSNETSTAGYTRVDASLSYTQRYGSQELTWFVLGKNLLDQDIRLSTSVLKDLAPAPGRNIILGLRTRF